GDWMVAIASPSGHGIDQRIALAAQRFRQAQRFFARDLAYRLASRRVAHRHHRPPGGIVDAELERATDAAQIRFDPLRRRLPDFDAGLRIRYIWLFRLRLLRGNGWRNLNIHILWCGLSSRRR